MTPGCVDTQVEPATRVEIRHNGGKEGLLNISIILGLGDLEIVTDVQGKLEQVCQEKIMECCECYTIGQG